MIGRFSGLCQAVDRAVRRGIGLERRSVAA
jgi:hypothetical protein